MKKVTAATRRFQENATLIAALRLTFQTLDRMGVTLATIADIAETSSGGTPSRGVSEYFGGDIPWIKSGDLTDGPILKVEEHINESGLENSSAQIFPAGTIVVALYGATVGKTGILTFAAASNQAVCAVMPKDNRITNEFLYWFLKHKRQDFLDASFGGAQPNISQKTLRETVIPVPSLEIQKQLCQFFEIVERRQRGDRSRELPELPPPLSEQRRIVAKIEQLAAKIEEARGLRDHASFNAEIVSNSSRSFVFSTLSGKYENYLLGNLLQMTSGENITSRQMNHSLPYAVYGGGGFAGRYDEYLYEESKIAIGRVGARCGCVFVTEPKSWVTDNALVITSFSDRLDMKFLVQALTHLDLRQQANQAAQPVVNQKRINAQRIPLPPLAEQRRIVAYLDGLQAQVDRLKALQVQTAAELEALLPSILDQAFKGEL